MKRALGQGGYEKRDQSRGSDEADKGSRGHGKGRGKGKGKEESRSKSAGAKDGDAAATEIIIQQLKSKPIWCPHQLKGNCSTSDSCPFPHLDEESVNRIKTAEKSQRDQHEEPDKAPERGRSPSRDKKGHKCRKGTSRAE